MRAVGYVRVSTDDQALNGVSLDAQKHAISSEVARRDGWELADLTSDTASGKSQRRRPGLALALERLDHGEYGALVVARLDRLSRSPVDVYDLMDRARLKGWSLVCLDPMVDMSTPFGRAMAGVAAVFAQLERELISQRTREGLAAARAAGTWTPTPRLIDAETEHTIVRLAGRGHSMRAIARMLDSEGVAPPRAGSWSDKTVAKVLARNPR